MLAGLCLTLAAGCASDDRAGLFEPELSSELQADIFAEGLTAYDRGDYERAFGLWLPLARKGNLTAMRNIGTMLRLGRGVAQDPERALAFYERAAAGGLTGAQINAAQMYRAGQGTEPDPEKAIDWLYVAASAGEALAMFFLGEMAEAGEGMRADFAKAVELYRMAARQGQAEAEARLAALNLADLDGPPDAPAPEPLALSQLLAGTEPPAPGPESPER